MGGPRTNDPTKPRWPWSVFKARGKHDPPNPLRYVSSVRLSLAAAILTVLLAALVVPALAVESEIRSDIEEAKASGFPQVPSGYASDAQISEFIEEWSLNSPGSPSRQEIEALSLRVGKYDDDSALFNVGIMFSLTWIVFVSAIAFVRGSNNLYALGFGFSFVSPAWAFASWFIPLMSFIVPWRLIAQILGYMWSHPASDERPRLAFWPEIVAGIWSVSFIGLWLLNPFTVNVFVPSNDIGEWLSKNVWGMRMMI